MYALPTTRVLNPEPYNPNLEPELQEHPRPIAPRVGCSAFRHDEGWDFLSSFGFAPMMDVDPQLLNPKP